MCGIYIECNAIDVAYCIVSDVQFFNPFSFYIIILIVLFIFQVIISTIAEINH